MGGEGGKDRKARRGRKIKNKKGKGDKENDEVHDKRKEELLQEVVKHHRDQRDRH